MNNICVKLLLLLMFQVNAFALPFPEEFKDQNVITKFNAKGDGVTDDTKNLRTALSGNRTPQSKPDYYYPFPYGVYLPKGIYLVSDSLTWIGCAMTLQGEGEGVTIIKLKDNCPGYTDPSKPKPVITTMAGNYSFRQNIHDLTIDVGKGNPGAVGLSWISNNNGCLKNVSIRSSDGKGKIGIDMMRYAPGPALIKNVSIDGFGYGMYIDNREYGLTLVNVLLKNQSIAGILNSGNMIHAFNLKSENKVPVIITENEWENQRYSMTTVINGSFTGGSPDVSAIVNKDYLYARNIETSGYKNAISSNGIYISGTSIKEFQSDSSTRLYPNSLAYGSLNLPIQQVPEFLDSTMSHWGKIPYNQSNAYYIDGNRLDSLLKSNITTIYSRLSGSTLIDREFSVPANIQLINGLNCVVNSDRGVGLTFVVDKPGNNPLIIERFGYGVKVKHLAKRPVVIRHGEIDYISQPGAGDLYIEDITTDTLHFYPGQHVWAYQLNTEVNTTKIINDGADLWIMGLKTEKRGTVIETKNGGRTELLGGLIYPLCGFTASEDPIAMFTCKDASLYAFCGWSIYGANCFYKIAVRETKNSETKTLLSQNVSGHAFPFYSGFQSTANVNFRQKIYKESTNPSYTLSITTASTRGIKDFESRNLDGRKIPKLKKENPGVKVLLNKR